jgi:hypothetical protein
MTRLWRFTVGSRQVGEAVRTVPTTLAIVAARDHPVVMDTLNQDIGTASGTETEAERQARLAGAAEGIVQASAAAGRMVDPARVKA